MSVGIKWHISQPRKIGVLRIRTMANVLTLCSIHEAAISTVSITQTTIAPCDTVQP